MGPDITAPCRSCSDCHCLPQRASFGMYNTLEEVEQLFTRLGEGPRHIRLAGKLRWIPKSSLEWRTNYRVCDTPMSAAQALQNRIVDALREIYDPEFR